jgi:hypothetical protein
MIASALKNIMRKKTSAELDVKTTKHSHFPDMVLRAWLKNRKLWDHSDWLSLLEDLRKNGYAKLTDCEEGRSRIGQFLETEREAIL